MKSKNIWMSSTFALLAMSGLVSCSNDDLTFSENNSAKTEIIKGTENVQKYFQGLPTPKNVIPAGEGENLGGDPIIVGEEGESEVGNLEELNGIPGRWVTTTRKYKLSAAFDESILLDPTADIMYPGCAVKGSTIADGTYAILSGCETTPVTFSINLVPVNPSDAPRTKATMVNIRKSDYDEALKQMLTLDYREAPVVTSASAEKVSNAKEFMAKLGVVAKTQVGDFGVNLGLNFDNNKTYVVAKCIQKFFTVSMDAPIGQTIFKTVDTQYMDNMQPVYVSNINYGRMLFFTLASENDSKLAQGALQFALSKLNGMEGVDITPELEAAYKSVLSTSDLRVTIVGGDNQYQSEVIRGGLDAMQKFMEMRIPYDQMKPISFGLRYAVDNSQARVVSSTEYTVTQRDFIPDFNKVSIRLNVAGFSAYNNIAPGLAPLDKNSVLAGKVWAENNGEYHDLLVIDENNPLIWEYRSGDWKMKTVNEQNTILDVVRSGDMDIKEFLNNTLLKFGADLKHVGRFPKSYGNSFTSLTLDQIYSRYQSGTPQIVIENQEGTRTVRTFINIGEMTFFNKAGQRIRLR